MKEKYEPSEKMNTERTSENIDLREKLSNLFKIKEQLSGMLENYKFQLEENNDVLVETAEQIIDFSKIPILDCHSTDHDYAPEGGDYYVITPEPIEDGVSLSASSSGFELVTKEGERKEIPDSYELFLIGDTLDSDDRKNVRVKLISYLFENPDLLKKFAK